MEGLKSVALVGTGAVGSAYVEAYVQLGVPIIGYDVNEERIARLQTRGLPVLHMSQFQDSEAEIILVCVGTPQGENGAIFTEYILSAIKTIGEWIPKRVAHGIYPVVAIRSTMFPGLTLSTMLPALEEASGLVAGTDFGLAHVPETLRETDALTDALNPWIIVIGEYDKRGSQILQEFFLTVMSLGENEPAPIKVSTVQAAEAAKFILNTRNATIISFYNMWALMLASMGITPQEAIDLSVFMGETPLNSWYGTVVGAAYGGACLPKEVAAFLHMADRLQVNASLLEGVHSINEQLKQMAAEGKAMPTTIKGYRRQAAQQLLNAAILAAQQRAADEPKPAEDEI